MFQHTRVRIVDRRFACIAAAACLLSLGVSVTGAQTCEEGVWTQVTPAVSPPPGAGAMAYDAVRQVAVLNLGEPAAAFSTWEWDGGNWSLRASGEGVPWGAMAFDTVRGYTLVVGPGTWSWDGTAWTRLSAFSPRVPSGMTGLAFDSGRGVAVLYAAGNDRDTWEWNGSTWTLVSSLGPDMYDMLDGPPAQNGFSICYDSNVDRTIVYGGYDYIAYNETWAWDGVDWTFVEWGPQPRHDAPMVFDPARNRRVLFGGWDVGVAGTDEVFNETWESGEGLEWTLVDTTGPHGRGMAAMAYDGARNNIVLFGGYEIGQAFGDTWIRTRRQVNGGPSIVTQPLNADVVVGGVATFQVEASGEGTITYRWRRDGQALQDSRRIVGARTNLLTISGVIAADEGSYDVVVSNPCESVTSDAATLDVVGVCPADFNADAIVNSQDFFDFLTAFFASSPAADFDESGTVDSGDFFAFLDAFFGKCV